MTTSKVAIIGCGLSGLVSAKETLNKGYEPVIFESSENIGGLWSYSHDSHDNHQSSIHWENLRTNISKFTCSFSDVSWPDVDSDVFPSRREMSQYLNDYADIHKIRPYIQFSCHINSVIPYDSGYIVTWTDKHGRSEPHFYPYVIITSGFFTDKIMSSIPGREHFKGNIYHSSQYRSSESFCGRKVMVIGASHSSAEIASEVAIAAAMIINISPRKCYTIPRYIPIEPACPASVMIPLDLSFYQLSNDRLANFSSIIQASSPSDDVIPNDHHLIRESMEVLFKDKESNKSSNRYFSALVGDGMVDNDDTIPYVAVSDNYDAMVKSGIIQICYGRLSSINDDGGVIIASSDDTLTIMHDIDDIIFCTGYKPNLSYLHHNILDIIEYDANDTFMPCILYHDIYHPQLMNLFFVGMYRGPYMAVIEQHAALVAGYISHHIPYPSMIDIQTGLETSRSIRRQHPRPQFPHADYVGHVLDLTLKTRRCPTIDHLTQTRYIIPSQFIIQDSTGDHNMIAHKHRDDVLSSIQQYILKLKSGYYIGSIILSRMIGKWMMTTQTSHQYEIMFNRTISDNGGYGIRCDSTDANSSSCLCNNMVFQYNQLVDRVEVYHDINLHAPAYTFQFTVTACGWYATSPSASSSELSSMSMMVRFKGAYIESMTIDIDRDGHRHKYQCLRLLL